MPIIFEIWRKTKQVYKLIGIEKVIVDLETCNGNLSLGMEF